jgi:hypothetical protein
MEDDYANYEKTKEFSSNTTAAGFYQGTSAGKSVRCLSCDRDLSQPNLLHPAISSSCAKPQGFSCGHGICGECGGLGAGLLAGI